MRSKDSPAQSLRLAILNDSPHVLKLLCDWFRQTGAPMCHPDGRGWRTRTLKWAVCTTIQTTERHSDKIDWEDNSHWRVALELVSCHSTQHQKRSFE